MKYKIGVILGILLFLNLVSAINGTLKTNLTQGEFEDLVDLNISGNLFINQNINTLGFIIFKPSKVIYGNFTIRTLTIGTERNVSGVLEDAIQMTSYGGNFYMHPELNLSSELFGTFNYAKLIASERFVNESECVKIWLGTRAEVVEIEKSWWQFWKSKTKIVYNPIIAYACEENLKEVNYYS